MTVRAKKRLGQHFLHDPAVIRKLIDAIRPQPTDIMVEIGGGPGALTAPLVERLERLHVVEIDRDLAAALPTRVAHPQRLVVHEADALRFDFGALAAGARTLRVVGNLPYNISTPLLFHLARFADRVRDMHFMLQREVVERMVAKHSTPEYGRLSVALQARFAMKKLFNVGSGAFRPPPKVDSAVVRLEPLAKPLAVNEDLLRKAFSARRKTLRNALPGLDFAAAGIDGGLRPENLSPADYARLSMNSIL